MLPASLTIRDTFPPASYDQWRALAEADLQGATFEQKLITHTYEGIDIRPLYTRQDQLGAGDAFGLPGAAPFVRGNRGAEELTRGWDLRQEHAHPDLAVTNQAILEDLAGGVTSLHLRLDLAGRMGLDADDAQAVESAGRDGVMIYRVADLDAALTGVHLEMIAVSLEAGAAFAPAAALLTALWRQRGVAPEGARGAFNADPLAVLARDGTLPVPLETSLRQMAELARWTAAELPHVTAVRVGTAPYHHAGATAAQDLAYSMATAVEYLRAMIAAGLSIDDAARQILFSMSVGTHQFLALSKLRAARRLWSRVVTASGGGAAAAGMRIHARISKRVLTSRDPYVNLLRNTTAVFAAGLGGADAITSVPFDAAIGLPNSFSRRIARNTALILQEEAHLHRVADPAGGGWYLDWLTNELSEKGWALFQEIERAGGMAAALNSGLIAKQIDSAFAPRAKNLARRKEGITGVSEFPHVGEERVERPAPDREALRQLAAGRLSEWRPSAEKSGIDFAPLDPAQMSRMATAAAAGATLGQLAAAIGFHHDPTFQPPLAPHPFAEPFEELREACDRFVAKQGQRPRVFLVNLGSAAHYTARASYAKNFFEAGGFEALGGESFRDAASAAAAFAASGATVAVICSSDKLYPELVPQVAPALKSAGARAVVLAGNPGANETTWREAGVDRFVFIKCDVLAILREMLREEGVLDGRSNRS